MYMAAELSQEWKPMDMNDDKKISTDELKIWLDKIKTPAELQILADTLPKELDNPLKWSIETSLKSAESAILAGNSSKTLSLQERNILDLSKMIDISLAHTNKIDLFLSNKVSPEKEALFKDSETLKKAITDPDTLDKLLKQPLNKWEFKVLITKIQEIADASSMSQEVKNSAKIAIAISVEGMAAKWFTIENQADIEFLVTNGWGKLKDIGKNIGKDWKFPGDTKYITKKDGENFTTESLDSTIALKQGANQITLNNLTPLGDKDKQNIQTLLAGAAWMKLPQGKNLTQADFAPLLDGLGKIPGIGAFLKGIFELVFGMSGIKNTVGEKIKELDDNGKKELLGKMLGGKGILNEKSIQGIKTIDDLKTTVNKEDPTGEENKINQEYISDVQKLFGVDKEKKLEVTIGTDTKKTEVLQYGSETQKAVAAFQATLYHPKEWVSDSRITGIFDKATAEAYQTSLKNPTIPTEIKTPVEIKAEVMLEAKTLTKYIKGTGVYFRDKEGHSLWKIWKWKEVTVTVGEEKMSISPINNKKVGVPTEMTRVKIDGKDGYIATEFLDDNVVKEPVKKPKKPKAKGTSHT